MIATSVWLKYIVLPLDIFIFIKLFSHNTNLIFELSYILIVCFSKKRYKHRFHGVGQFCLLINISHYSH